MKFSVVIPTKDRPHGLKSAVKSAYDAIPDGSEIIVIDDGSRIPPNDILSSISVNSLRIYSNPGTQGPSASRNFGVNFARKPIILFLDDDDKLLPNYCQRIEKVLNDYPEITFGSSGFIKMSVNKSGRLITSPGKLNFKLSGRLDNSVPLRFRMPSASGLWVKRKLFLSLSGFDEELRINEDTEFCIRLARNNEVMWLDPSPGRILNQGRYRNFSDNNSLSRDLGQNVRIQCYKRILDKHSEFLQRQDNSIKWFFLRRIWKYRLKSLFFD